ncbi:hypothetical protein TNIN_88741 [Trichonephila inaurata madagascariensis]|uniref:Uncharacterized protein n=1 Tax=Trichonephila inaurata madagascariensis TaxID=2747483 RepID=A0A8X6XXE0_9ARAC|nr:hypothetical protein TNIN_88741 [Trichonephila inaurata madagascariensis]
MGCLQRALTFLRIRLHSRDLLTLSEPPNYVVQPADRSPKSPKIASCRSLPLLGISLSLLFEQKRGSVSCREV